jgi:hypothetical protein
MIKALAELANCIHEDPVEIAILCSWQMASFVAQARRFREGK